MDKSAEAFRTISEVAVELEIPKHVLRFWEGRFLQLRPMKRGGGRRYYRPADVELLKGIRHLLYEEGYTIKGVQKVLREHGIEFVKELGLPDGDGEKDTPREPRPAVGLNGAHPPESKRRQTASAAPAIASADRRELQRALSALETAQGLLRPQKR